jgi:hypothetical protein
MHGKPRVPHTRDGGPNDLSDRPILPAAAAAGQHRAVAGGPAVVGGLMQTL